MQFPALTHVAVTVSDLATSVAWYRRLIGADPVLDEDTGPFHHVVFAIGGLGTDLLLLPPFLDISLNLLFYGRILPSNRLQDARGMRLLERRELVTRASSIGVHACSSR